jgi:hypothetical protein
MDQWSAMINVADRGRGNIGQVSMAVPPRKAPPKHPQPRPQWNRLVGPALHSLSRSLSALQSVYWRAPHVELVGRRAHGRFLACLLCEFCACKVQTPICCLNSEFKRLARPARALTQRPHARKPIYVTKSTKKSVASAQQVVSSFAPGVLYGFYWNFPPQQYLVPKAPGAVLRKFRRSAKYWC